MSFSDKCICFFAYVAIIVSLQALVIHAEDTLTCDKLTHFQCAKSGSCLPLAKICDGQFDCSDKSDEEPVIDCSNYTRNCTDYEFRCASELFSQCILRSYVCDKDFDCRDKSDEAPILDCLKYHVDNPTVCEDHKFLCGNVTYPKCIFSNFVCDGSDDCGEGSDEPPIIQDCSAHRPNCTDDEFRCNNTRCIKLSYVCDAGDDCGDNSDEETQLCAPFVCGLPDHFTCAVSGKCIRDSSICDTANDCGDNDTSDEIGCLDYNDCPKHTFACKVDKNTTKCVNERNKCDGYRDCIDASDELGCPPKHNNGTWHCPSSQFECRNHLCISPEDLCNGVDDCFDGLDESPEICDKGSKLYQLFGKSTSED